MWSAKAKVLPFLAEAKLRLPPRNGAIFARALHMTYFRNGFNRSTCSWRVAPLPIATRST